MIGTASARDTPVRVGVDVGGTFTDAVVAARGRLVTAKVPSTPADQSIGVLRAVDEALAAAGLNAHDVRHFAHGMTVGTNALLEGKGARTALVTTEGFGDLLELRRQNRAHLYRLSQHHPPALVERHMVVEARERVGPDGILRPLDDAEITRVVDAVAACEPESVAVGLLFSFREASHEARLTAALRSALPDIHVSASHEVIAQIREYERIATTTVDAYLTPVLTRYLSRLGDGARDAGLPAPLIMQSNGGVLDIASAKDHAAWTVLSGPAGGVIGAAEIAARMGTELLLTFDMGGTSCDVALIRDQQPARTTETVIAGSPLSLPMLDIETVSAGGGSIGWVDSGGALRVGPQSAGARPGPAAYGHGGTRPTVTDANLVLGRLDPDHAFGGDIFLDIDAARSAVDTVALPLGLSAEECAAGIIEVAVEEMVRALRRVSVERGADPRGAAILAFGGAGPLHACDVADALGVSRVIVPPVAGLLAALGLIVAGERRDFVQTVLCDATDLEALVSTVDALSVSARELPDAQHEVAVECRYRGQAFSLAVPWDVASGTEGLVQQFHRSHRERYGDAHPERPVEAVTVRLAAVRPGTAPQQTRAEPLHLADGPTRLPADGATCWVASGWTARRDESGLTVLERA